MIKSLTPIEEIDIRTVKSIADVPEDGTRFLRNGARMEYTSKKVPMPHKKARGRYAKIATLRPGEAVIVRDKLYFRDTAYGNVWVLGSERVVIADRNYFHDEVLDETPPDLSVWDRVKSFFQTAFRIFTA